MRVGILASGVLGLYTIQKCYNFINPSFIATDSNSNGIISFSKQKGVSLFVGNPRKGKLKDFIGSEQIDVLLSINYLFLIEEEVIELVKYPINFHGSLLPKYRGRTPHVWSIINNEKITGITAHIIDKGCDTGDIIFQETLSIGEKDTGASILDKYRECYPSMVKKILNCVKENKINLIPQDEKQATYFGKRTPEDGLIQWNWQKERLHNWVRAQAFPYPGAFTLVEGVKIIIDEVTFSNFGYNDDMPNGLILEDQPEILVKTPNGVIILKSIRSNAHLCTKGKIFEYED